MRAIFTAQDPKTIRDAFDAETQSRAAPALRGGGGAAAGRPDLQSVADPDGHDDAPGSRVKGVIGIGRVKTPTLAIVCMREIEILNFSTEDYFEIVATATVEKGSFLMRHAPPAKDRIRDAPGPKPSPRRPPRLQGPAGGVG